jgi:hypothetical protein
MTCLARQVAFSMLSFLAAPIAFVGIASSHVRTVMDTGAWIVWSGWPDILWVIDAFAREEPDDG